MKFYIAASLNAKDEATGLANALRDQGYTVTSRWHDIETGYNRTHRELQESLQMDIDDLEDAAELIHLSETRSSGGGADGEVGYAVARGMRIHVIGPRKNIFHWHDKCRVYAGYAEFMEALV